MGNTGVQRFKASLRFAALLVIAFQVALWVNCGGSSSKSTPPDTGTLALSTTDGASASNLTFNYLIHETVKPAPVTINVKSTSGTEVDYSASTDVSNPNWLSVLPNNGTTPGAVTVTVLPLNLDKGTYTGHVIFLGPGSRATSTIVLNVQSTTKPIIDLSPTSLSFTAVQGGSDPSPKLFSVKNDHPNSNPAQLLFSVSTDSPWLEASSQSNVATTSVTVQPHVGSLAPGTYTGKVTITDPDAFITTATVDVAFTVTAP